MRLRLRIERVVTDELNSIDLRLFETQLRSSLRVALDHAGSRRTGSKSKPDAHRSARAILQTSDELGKALPGESVGRALSSYLLGGLR